MTITIRSWLVIAYAVTAVAQFGFNHTQYGGSPAVYPSPQISGTGGWHKALEKARAFVAALTIEEKAQMVTGTSFLHMSATSDESWIANRLPVD